MKSMEVYTDSEHNNISYSVDYLLLAAFDHELKNFLQILPDDQIDEEKVAVINYLEKRIKHIKNRTK